MRNERTLTLVKKKAEPFKQFHISLETNRTDISTQGYETKPNGKYGKQPGVAVEAKKNQKAFSIHANSKLKKQSCDIRP